MIGLNFKGMNSSRRALETLIKSTRAGCIREIRRACVATKSKARAYAPKATGNLREKIEYEITDDGLRGTVTSGAPYAPFVEGIYHNYTMGRGPGRWPPGGSKSSYRPILEWALIKGIVIKWFGQDTISARNSTEFLIRRKIGRKGTPAKPHMWPSYLLEAPIFRQNLKRIFNQAATEAARVGGLLK